MLSALAAVPAPVVERAFAVLLYVSNALAFIFTLYYLGVFVTKRTPESRQYFAIAFIVLIILSLLNAVLYLFEPLM